MDNIDYVSCEDCGSKILSGDVMHVEGKDVCEYCYDQYECDEY